MVAVQCSGYCAMHYERGAVLLRIGFCWLWRRSAGACVRFDPNFEKIPSYLDVPACFRDCSFTRTSKRRVKVKRGRFAVAVRQDVDVVH